MEWVNWPSPDVAYVVEFVSNFPNFVHFNRRTANPKCPQLCCSKEVGLHFEREWDLSPLDILLPLALDLTTRFLSPPW